MTASRRDERPNLRNTAEAPSAVLICSRRVWRDAAVCAALEEAGVAVAEVVHVEDVRPTAPMGREWQARGVRVAVAAGGDGTICSVATQIVGSELLLGILPLGTSNDTARSLHLPLDMAKAADVIATGVPTTMDAGRVLADARGGEHTTSGAESTVARAGDGIYFLHALTLGVNVAFARLATDLVRRQRWGRLTYAAAALGTVTQFEPLEAAMTLEGVERHSLLAAAPDERGMVALERRVVQIAAVNLPIFGGGLNLALRGTALHDHLLDVVVIEAPSLERIREIAHDWFEARRQLGVRGHARNVLVRDDRRGAQSACLPVDIAGMPIPGVTRYQARALTVRTPSPVDVTLDGDIRARTPLRVEAAPGVIRVLLPPAARLASNLAADMVR